jgi:protein-S-isoprenylcysteine O-methyltransferase Ste14
MKMNFSSLFLIISAIWVISEILLLVLCRSKNDSQDHDKGSIKWLNIIIYLSVAFAVSFGFSGIGIISTAVSALPWVGLYFIVVGLLIRWTAILTLRKYFTTNVVIQSDHRIIKTGLYRFVRHPSYSGAIISFCGLGLAFSNWISFIVLFVPITIAFLKRIQIEEQALQNAFGEEYTYYRKMSWALCPWLY